MFYEQPNNEYQNRKRAQAIGAGPAQLADGTNGVCVNFGNYFAVLTNHDAIRIAGYIADQVERNSNAI